MISLSLLIKLDYYSIDFLYRYYTPVATFNTLHVEKSRSIRNDNVAWFEQSNLIISLKHETRNDCQEHPQQWQGPERKLTTNKQITMGMVLTSPHHPPLHLYLSCCFIPKLTSYIYIFTYKSSCNFNNAYGNHQQSK